MSNEPTCEVVGLSHAYRATQALTDVSFTLRAGRVTGLVGANGSGKSTLLRVLAGAQRADTGTVRLFGVDLASSEAAVAGVGASIDGMSLWPGWTVKRTLDYVAGLAGVSRSLVETAVHDAQILDAAHKRLRTLSLGNRQRVSLAAATLAGTRMVLLDEPMNGLDPQARQHTRDLIIRLAAEHRTVLLSSHDLHDVESLASDLIVLGQGAVVYHGPTSEFRANTRMAVLSMVGDINRASYLLAQEGIPCHLEAGSELVLFAHDAPAAIELLANAWLPAHVASERPATLEERFHGAQ